MSQFNYSFKVFWIFLSKSSLRHTPYKNKPTALEQTCYTDNHPCTVTPQTIYRNGLADNIDISNRVLLFLKIKIRSLIFHHDYEVAQDLKSDDRRHSLLLKYVYESQRPRHSVNPTMPSIFVHASWNGLSSVTRPTVWFMGKLSGAQRLWSSVLMIPVLLHCSQHPS